MVVVVVSHNAGKSFSSLFPSGIAVVIMSPFTVVPLQRGEGAACGLSQLLQSLSSNESTVSGVHEKCLVRFEFVLFGRPKFAVSDSVRGSENRDAGVGVWSLLNALAAWGREDVTDARMVSLSLSLWRLDTLRPLPDPVMGSSPTATCRKSSTNVHNPDLKSSAICFMPAFDGEVDEERGVQVARFETPLTASGCLVRFWK